MALKSSQAARSGALDALRAVAALMVVGAHTLLLVPVGAHPNPVLNLVRAHLWTGVDVFFALSGLLIAAPFIRALLDGGPLPSLRGYLLRRAGRITPAYWAVLSVFLLLGVGGLIGQRSRYGGTPSATSVLLHYLLLQNWIPGQSRTVFTVAWTLSIEALFYLFVPLAAVLVRRRHPAPIPPERLLVGVTALGIGSLVWAVLWGVAFDHLAILQAHPGWYTVIEDNLPARLGLFCPGMLAAVVLASTARPRAASGAVSERLGRVPSGALLIAAGTAWVAGIAVGGHLGHGWAAVRDSFFMPVACGLPLLIALRHGTVVRVVARVLAPLGVVSYGLYLWHWVVIGLLDNGAHLRLAGGPWFAWVLALLLVCALTLPLAVASWFFVERPALRATAAWARQGRAVMTPDSITAGAKIG
ncbi:MAG: acyltransferase family protein [Candidatus Dormibacteria bacterium]